MSLGSLSQMLGEPAPPNPAAISQQSLQTSGAQIAQNTGVGIQNQAGSNYNQSDPYGSLSYSQTGTGPNGTPIYSSNVDLSQPQQGLLNTLQGTQQTAGNQAGALLSGANYGASTPASAIGNLQSGLVQQNTNEYLQAEQPFFTTQTSQLDTQLRNEGLAPGQPAYDNAMRSLNTNQGLTVAGATAAYEPSAYTQAQQEYTLPATLATQLGQFGAPANPTSQLEGGAALGTQVPNSAGDLAAATTGAENQYTAQQNQYNSMISGLMNIGTMGLSGGLGGGVSSALAYLPGGSAAGATPTAVNGGIYPMFS
jgi:hypothetical protein